MPDYIDYNNTCLHLIKHDDGRSHAFQVVICPMTRKNEVFYTEVFNVIKELILLFDPNSIMADFELTQKNALATSYPNTLMKGCWFHYNQTIIE